MEQIQQGPLQMSEDQFLAWAEAQEGRFELVEGDVMPRAGATRDHERVVKRIFALLYSQLDESLYDVNKGGFGVSIRLGSGKDTILYPDAVVDRQSGSGDEQSTTQPIVVIEVLSRSMDYDHHVRKLESYKKLDTLAQYVVFDQKEPRVFVWAKTAAGWPGEPQTIEGIGGALPLPSVGTTISLAEIYRS